jgi:hypothetical protein
VGRKYASKIFVTKLLKKRPLGRHKHRGKDNIKIKEVKNLKLGRKFLLQCAEPFSHFPVGCSVMAVWLESVAVDQKTVDLHSVKIKTFELHYSTITVLQYQIHNKEANIGRNAVPTNRLL